MKNILLLLIIILNFGCNTSQTDSYDVEDKIYQCIKEKYLENNIDTDKLITDIEQFLIEEKALQNKSGKSYIDFIDKSIVNQNLQISIPSHLSKLIQQFPSYVPKQFICDYIPTDSIILQNSRYGEIAKESRKVFESVASTGDLNPELIASKMMTVIKPEDLNHPLFKVLFLRFLDTYSQMKQDRGIGIKLPPWAEDEPDAYTLQERNVLSILVNKKNELIVREKKMKVKNLKSKVKNFIGNPDQNPLYAVRADKAIISLRNDRGTDYEAYIKVYNEIKAAYDELRNEKAINDFGKTFKELNNKQQKEIKSKIPLVISEAEPTAFGEEN